MNYTLQAILFCVYSVTFLLITSHAFKQYKITYSEKCATLESMFRILYEKSLSECVFECDVRPKCNAVNYRKRRLQCELLENGDSATFVPKTEQTGPCVYINRSNIYMNSSECCGNNCTIGQVCNTDKGECIIKECPPLSVKNSTIFGNMYQVESRLKIKCNEGYAAVDNKIYTMCNTSGQWDPPVSCLTTDRCASTPCLNGGSCGDGEATYTCTCAPGYEGENCQTNTNDCATNPCLNGAVCEDGVNAYTCSFDFVSGGVNYKTNYTYENGNLVLECTNQNIMTIRVYQNKLSQPNAAGACISVGGTLVKIDTQLKQEFIRNVLDTKQEYLAEDFWIGGSKQNENDTWRFADGTNVAMTKGVFWETMAPNGHTVEFCVKMRGNDGNHLWNDSQCSTLYGYICEIPLTVA